TKLNRILDITINRIQRKRRRGTNPDQCKIFTFCEKPETILYHQLRHSLTMSQKHFNASDFIIGHDSPHILLTALNKHRE
ncbi:hypothetical protein L9F63_022405, partial [Diploptera punctata]